MTVIAIRKQSGAVAASPVRRELKRGRRFGAIVGYPVLSLTLALTAWSAWAVTNTTAGG